MTRIDPMKRALLKLFGLAALGGCASAMGEGRSVSAVVINYTDRYIADVSVNGRWAGSANAYGGEGNRVEGFLAPRETDKKVVLKVKWIVADTYDIATNKYTRKPDESRQVDVELSRPYPSNPSYLILHFFPDGHVEVELSADRPARKIPKPAGYHR